METSGSRRVVGSGLGRVDAADVSWAALTWPTFPVHVGLLEMVVVGDARPAPEIPVTPEEELAWIELEHRLASMGIS